MSAAPVSRWRDGRLEPVDDDDGAAALRAADSWLVEDGKALAIESHRTRFLSGMPATLGAAAFWDAAIDAIPRRGAWFPRFELRGDELRLRMRPTPARDRSVTLLTHPGPDPRIAPRTKGPDLELLHGLREAARPRGAGDVVLLGDGYVAEGASSSIAWWIGDALCVPAADIPRLDGVTLGALVTLATALGVEVIEAHATPAELNGCEIWALNALHGIRIVTSWIDGPATAEQPGRLATWQARLDALRRPLPETQALPQPDHDAESSA